MMRKATAAALALGILLSIGSTAAQADSGYVGDGGSDKYVAPPAPSAPTPSRGPMCTNPSPVWGCTPPTGSGPSAPAPAPYMPPAAPAPVHQPPVAPAPIYNAPAYQGPAVPAPVYQPPTALNGSHQEYTSPDNSAVAVPAGSGEVQTDVTATGEIEVPTSGALAADEKVIAAPHIKKLRAALTYTIRHEPL